MLIFEVLYLSSVSVICQLFR